MNKNTGVKIYFQHLFLFLLFYFSDKNFYSFCYIVYCYVVFHAYPTTDLKKADTHTAVMAKKYSVNYDA